VTCISTSQPDICCWARSRSTRRSTRQRVRAPARGGGSSSIACAPAVITVAPTSPGEDDVPGSAAPPQHPRASLRARGPLHTPTARLAGGQRLLGGRPACRPSSPLRDRHTCGTSHSLLHARPPAPRTPTPSKAPWSTHCPASRRVCVSLDHLGHEGTEMARHAAITAASDTKIYFCDPGSPWQRGSNENTACHASTS
jgi:hypothetical protein